MGKYSGWMVHPVRRDGQIVWVIYRLRDAEAEDVIGNREYWPRGECPALAQKEKSARDMARILNELGHLHRRV